MGRRKQKANNAVHATEQRRKRRRLADHEQVTESQLEVPLLRNCSNCQRTELHQHDESLSLTRISEYDIQQNKKGKFSMLAGESWECWKYFVGKSWFMELPVELYGHLLFGKA